MKIKIPHNYQPRDYQLPLWRALTIEQKKRAIYVWHRRAGKDLLALNLIIYHAFYSQVGTYWHIFPSYAQGSKSIWQETDSQGRKYIDYFPKSLIAKKNEKELKVVFKNGSIYQIVGSDNPDSLRGAGIKGAVFSEFAEQDPRAWSTIQPMLLENNGFAMFNFTPKGQNHAYELFKMAQSMPKEWHSEIKTAKETGVFTEEQLEQVKKEILAEGKTLDFFNQEFLCSFNNPIEGSYYSKIINEIEINKQISDVSFNRNLPVYTFWDIGYSDSTAIWFCQIEGKKINLIDYIEDNHKPLDYYLAEVKNKPYVYANHYAPHDFQNKNFQTGMSSQERALQLGFNFMITPNISIQDGINAVRSILYDCYFDKIKTMKGLIALKNYKNQFDFKRNDFKTTPYHDWSSHSADAFRYLAVNIKMILPKQALPIRALDSSTKFY